MMSMRMKSLAVSWVAALCLTMPMPASGEATPIDWATQANHLRLVPGTSKAVACPAHGQISSRLWGTDVYTDDSSICTAAVHAGLLAASTGGTVQVEGRAGQPAYQGSQRHGVSSKDYGAWTGSFVFLQGPAAGGAQASSGGGVQVIASPNPAAAGTDIQVAYQGAPGNARDWIGLYLVGAGERGWVTWQYTQGNRQGAMTFKAPANQPGSYEFRMYENDGYKLLATSPTVQVGSAPAAASNKSLTGAWVHSSVGTTQTPDNKVVILQEGDQVTLVQSYKMEVNRNRWQTLRCVGPLKSNQIRFDCNWVPGGNPMGYGGPWQPVFDVSADRDHLDGVGKEAHHYSRVP